MKKNRWIIIILVLIIFVFVLYLILKKEEEKYFNKIEIENVNIFNTTNVNYLDTIVYSGLKELNIKDVVIVIKELSENDKKLLGEDIDLKAHIKGENNTYIIFIDNKLNRYDYIRIMSHELIHLKQYYHKELVLINNEPFWYNVKIFIEDYSYENLPWEKDAFNNQNELKNKMVDILYN